LHRSNLSHISSWRRNAQGKSVAEGINESNSPAPDEMETAMKFEFIRRYFRERRAYWNVIRELSTYSDRALGRPRLSRREPDSASPRGGVIAPRGAA
jgi:hypothetical protein